MCVFIFYLHYYIQTLRHTFTYINAYIYLYMYVFSYTVDQSVVFMGHSVVCVWSVASQAKFSLWFLPVQCSEVSWHWI